MSNHDKTEEDEVIWQQTLSIAGTMLAWTRLRKTPAGPPMMELLLQVTMGLVQLLRETEDPEIERELHTHYHLARTCWGASFNELRLHANLRAAEEGTDKRDPENHPGNECPFKLGWWEDGIGTEESQAARQAAARGEEIPAASAMPSPPEVFASFFRDREKGLDH